MSDAIDFEIRFAQGIASREQPAGGSPAAFAVYRNTWLKGLLDALAANFPTVAMLLGPELFRDVAVEFAREHPANSPVLALYGAEFPDFVGDRLGGDIPYLRDVAALERLWTESFFAADADALAPAQYAALRPAQLLGLQVGVHPATRIARFRTPAVTIWKAHRSDGHFEEIEPDWRPEGALVTRRDLSVDVMAVDDATYHILVEIERGRTVGAAIGSAAEACPGSDLARALTTIIESGALTAAAQS
ncbi:MAG: DUF2063 domain-containing protein [Sphingomonas sp.]|nr:DUF2063 domain-containing protein [Sphingomonas sp.]